MSDIHSWARTPDFYDRCSTCGALRSRAAGLLRFVGGIVDRLADGTPRLEWTPDEPACRPGVVRNG